MNKKVLLVNDLPGVGKVALSAMFPILANKGHSIYNLPTALVSNTLDYGLFEILDTSDYMQKTLAVWEKLGFSFDAMATGFIVSQKQVELIKQYVFEHPNMLVMVDPIMGDDGKLYNGIDESTIAHMCELCNLADIILPNVTEACFIANKFVGNKQFSDSQIHELINSLRKDETQSVVITSIVKENKHVVAGYDAKLSDYFEIEFDYIDVQFPGTGDIFSAEILGEILKGDSLKEAVAKAMKLVAKLIDLNKDNKEKYCGVLIEQYLANHETKN